MLQLTCRRAQVLYPQPLRIHGYRMPAGLTDPAVARPSGYQVSGFTAGEMWHVIAASLECLQPAEGGIVPEVGPFPSLLRAAPFWNTGCSQNVLDDPGAGHEHVRGLGWSVT